MTPQEKAAQKKKLELAKKQIGEMLKIIRQRQKISLFLLERKHELDEINIKKIEKGGNTTIKTFMAYLNAINAILFIPNKLPPHLASQNDILIASLLEEGNTLPFEIKEIGTFLKERREEKDIKVQDIVKKGLHYRQITAIEEGTSNYRLDSLLLYIESINCYFMVR